MKSINTSQRYWYAFSLLLVLVAAPFDVAAKDDKVELKASFSRESVRPEEHIVLSVEAKVPQGYHLYSMTPIKGGPKQLKIDVAGPGLENASPWHAPAAKVEFDKNFDLDVEYFAEAVSHQRVLRVGENPGGETSAEIVASGQICNEHRCIPFKETVLAALTVTQGQARPEYASISELPGKAYGVAAKGGPPLGDGLLSFLIIAFLAGLGALATPCVFPMIPITISFFSKFSAISMRRAVTMATIYAGSIVGVFTLVGVAVSIIFGAVGMQILSASPLFNLFLTALLVFFALNLFGLFEIRVPLWLVSRTSEKEQQLTSDDGSLFRQAAGVFFMAVTFTLVSFTCTVGFMGVVIAQASQGEWFYPTIGMLVFSFAFALPFFFLAVFPSWADRLQGKGGDWMVAVKAVLGFLELAGAMKFLSNVDLVLGWGAITRPFVLALWVGIFGAAGFFLLRFFNLPHSDRDANHVGPLRMIVALCLLSLAFYSSTGIRDTKSMGGWLDGWLPPAVYPGEEEQILDIAEGIELGVQLDKPVFVDFTGYTCTNCRYMEGSMFPKPAVRSRLDRMVVVTAYTDGADDGSDERREYQLQRFETAALPFYAILDPRNDEVLATFADMTNDEQEYLAFLDKGLSSYKSLGEASKPDDPVADMGSVEANLSDSQVEQGKGEFTDVSIDLAPSGKPVDFEFPTLDGKTKRKLSASRGKWTFLNFWASWCAPCRKEIKNDFPPALAANPHIELVTVAFDGEESKREALEFAKQSKLLEHIALLGGEDITEAGLDPLFAVSETLPISYLIHPDGHIAWRRQGSVDAILLKRLFAQTAPKTD